MAHKNIFSGFALLLLCGIGFFSISQLASGGEHVQYGPGFFPRMFLGVLAFGACILIVRGFFSLRIERAQHTESSVAVPGLGLINSGRLLLFAFFIVCYIILFQSTGFIFSTICFLIAAQILYGRRRYLSIGMVAICGAVLTYFVLATAFEVPLPLIFGE